MIVNIVTDDDLIAFLLDQYKQTGNHDFMSMANSIQLSRREIDFLRWQLKRYEWISVEDGLPEDYNKRCLIYIPNRYPNYLMTVAKYSHSKNSWIGVEDGTYYYDHLTHYMPLPSPPTEKEH